MPISEQRGKRPSPSGAAVATPGHSRLTVLSGPSGVGKSTVVAELNKTCPQIWISVSVTTRPPRQGEVDGREYHFADGAEFDAKPGDVTALPQGHDAWVVGDEPVVVVDWYGASNYART